MSAKPGNRNSEDLSANSTEKLNSLGCGWIGNQVAGDAGGAAASGITIGETDRRGEGLMRSISVSILVCSGICAASMLSGCSTSRPIFYPNQHLQSTSQEEIDADLKFCTDLADKYAQEPDKYHDLARSGLTGGAVGAGAGALGGVIVGSNVGRSLGAGAAVGAVVAIANEILKNDDKSPPYQAFVNYCMNKKGYEITGWR